MDLISREAAIDALCHIDEYNGLSLKAIRNLPSVQPEQRWIPCSERLPEKRDWYLGVFRESNTGWVNPLPYICDYLGYRSMSTTKDGWILLRLTDDIDGQVNKYFSEMLECVAWMPMPEPYKEGDDGCIC